LFDIDKNLRPENKETVREFFERVYKAIDMLRKEYGDKNILIVSSNGVNQVFHAYFNNLKWEGNMRRDVMQNGDMREYDFARIKEKCE
jgi:broad specificity phosphatase PhoE